MAHNSTLHCRSGALGSSDIMGTIRLIVDKLDNFACNEGTWQADSFWPSHQTVRTVRQQAKPGIPE